MQIITSIKPQRNQKRVNIYLDGRFGFGIDLENFVTLGLKVEQELSDEEVEKIVKKADFQKSLDKVLRFATTRPRSEREIKDYFKRKDFNELIHQSLLDKLKHFNLIDDEKFAKWWVEQRLEFKSKSKRDIEYELRNKGIKKEIIEKVLGETKIDEEKMARQLLEKKAYKWKSLPARLARQKMLQYLAGKGFEWEVSERVVKKQLK